MYIGEILRRGTQNLSYIRWSLIGFCVILSTPIRKGFVSQQAFRPSHLFIATWDEVGYFKQKSDLVSLFNYERRK